MFSFSFFILVFFLRAKDGKQKEGEVVMWWPEGVTGSRDGVSQSVPALRTLATRA